MGITRAQCWFQGTSGLPEDRYVNDLYVSTTGTFDFANAADFRDAWANFFNDSSHKVADYLSDNISRSSDAAKINFYDVPGPGSPIEVASWTPAAIGSVQSLPHELACAVSYHGDLSGVPETAANPSPPPAVIRPASRRRGRFYVGPLNIACLGTESFDVRVNTTFIGILRDAMNELVTDLDAADMTLGVWSPTDGDFYPIDGGWIDNGFDIQRRRGSVASVRTSL